MKKNTTRLCLQCGQDVSRDMDNSDALARCPWCNSDLPLIDNGHALASLETMESQASIDTATRGDSLEPRDASGTSGSEVSGISFSTAIGAVEATIRTLGRFELKSVLGVGGFGRVYRAYDPRLDRMVALKVPMFGPKQEVRIARFISEAKAAARLQHPNIVSTYEVGQADGRCFIASAYIEGEQLSERIKREQPSVIQAVRWVSKLADALHCAHQQGIVHRDVKPHNVIIDHLGEPQLMDFGLAKRLDDDSRVTTDGTLLGTPAYMSPEQARGEVANVKAASDQYSLGVVLYRMLTGQTPHQGSPHVVISKVAAGGDHSVRDLVPGIDRSLDAICRKALASEASERYDSCQALAEDLRSWEGGRPVSVRPPSPWQHIAGSLREHRLIVGMFASIIVLAFAAAVMGWKLVNARTSGAGSPSQFAELINDSVPASVIDASAGTSADESVPAPPAATQSAVSLTSGPGEKTPDSASPASPLPEPPLIAYPTFQLANDKSAFRERLQQVRKQLTDAAPILKSHAATGHIVMGKIVVADGDDVDLVSAQMPILPDGCFIGATKDLHHPIGFRMHQYAPLDVSLTGRTGSMVDLGVITMRKLADTELVPINVDVSLAGASDSSSAFIELSVSLAPRNTPKNGSEPPARPVEPIRIPVPPDGKVRGGRFSPIPYYCVIRAPGYVSQTQTVSFDPAKGVSLKPITLEKPQEVQLEFIVQADADAVFDNDQLESTIVKGGDRWQAAPLDYGWDLEFRQTGRTLSFDASYTPVTLADLGTGALSDFLNIDKSRATDDPTVVSLRSGHVYLLNQQHFQRYVLFKVNDSGPSTSSPARLGSPKPVLQVKGWSSAWSPDSRKLLYNTGSVSPVPGGMLQWQNLDTGEVGDIVPGGKDEVCAATGTRLVAYETGGTLSVCDLDGSHRRDIGAGGFPSWNADGNTMYFMNKAEWHVMSIDVTQPDVKPKKLFPYRGYYPAVSSSGRFIAYGSGSRMLVVDVASAKERHRFETVDFKGLLAGWSPDEKFVAFGDYGHTGVGLWVMNTESGNTLKVLDGGFTLPRWSPDGTLLSCDNRQRHVVEVFRVEDLRWPE